MTLGLSYREVRKTEGSRNRDSTVFTIVYFGFLHGANFCSPVVLINMIEAKKKLNK